MDLQTAEGETQIDISVPRVREMGVSSANAYVEAKYFQYPVCGETPWDDLRCVLDDSDEMIADCIQLFERSGGKFKIARENEWIEFQKNDQILSIYFSLLFRLIVRHFHTQSQSLPHRSVPHFQMDPAAHPDPLSSQRNCPLARPHRPILSRGFHRLARRPRRHHPPFPVGIHSFRNALRGDRGVPRFFVRFREPARRFAVAVRLLPAVFPSVPADGFSGRTWKRGTEDVGGDAVRVFSGVERGELAVRVVPKQPVFVRVARAGGERGGVLPADGDAERVLRRCARARR